MFRNQLMSSLLYLQILSCSPGLTNTGLIPSSGKLMKILIDKMFYSSEAAMYSIFIGLFSPHIKGGEYIHNSPSIMLDTQFGKAVFGVGSDGQPSKAPKMLRLLTFVMQSFYQAIYYGDIVYSAPNQICSNTELSEKLYQWSLWYSRENA